MDLPQEPVTLLFDDGESFETTLTIFGWNPPGLLTMDQGPRGMWTAERRRADDFPEGAPQTGVLRVPSRGEEGPFLLREVHHGWVEISGAGPVQAV
ncbi:hypothetical protein [Yinghuangia sp. YIM S09857]|uniref:hypothetical protein n=1 Tax=Yinghuangia sp. YIM S09857 TaxID=3436929 RepID=UPI003F532611